MKIKSCALLLVFCAVCVVCRAEETEPSEIFKKVLAAYEAIDTYSDEGTVVQDIEMNGQKTHLETPFTIKLKKPNMYLITWDPKMPMMSQSGAVWSDGTQPYLYMDATKSYSKLNKDEVALGGATGISGGAAHTIPSLFLKVFQGHVSPFSNMSDPKLQDSEQVGGEDCYVIAGGSKISKEETFWISKKDFLIRKYERSFEPPPGGIKFPEFTDQQLEASIKSMGQEATEEKKEAMRKMMKQAAETAQNSNLKGTATETHDNIAAPKLSPDDFQFKVPEGTNLKPFPIGGWDTKRD